MLFEESSINSVLSLMRETLTSCDVNADALFVAAGIDPDFATDGGERVPVERMKRVWELAYLETGDPCFGLRVAGCLRPTHLHALGLAWLASLSVGDALRRLERYHEMLSTVLSVSLEQAGDETILRFAPLERSRTVAVVEDPTPSSEAWPAHPVDAFGGAVVSLCRQLAGDEFRPLTVELRRDDPQTDGHRSFFGVPVTFGSKQDAIRFRTADLERQIPAGSRELAQAIDGIVERYLRSMQVSPTMREVYSILIDLLPSGEVTESRVARRMHASVSTLQRRLRQEGTTFRRMLDETRKELALRYVPDGAYSLAEISFLLGFSDQASMSRAFKRWTGVPPGSYVEHGQGSAD